MFSASQRANGYRKRFKHKGQTASIYLSDSVAEERGKYQIGTLCHTIAIKGGPVILSSVPDQKQKTLQHCLISYQQMFLCLLMKEFLGWKDTMLTFAKLIIHSGLLILKEMSGERIVGVRMEFILK
ncbi:hypothetical protein [Leptospira noguchii]|uniref:hypothetical protein n=1 Tax=Leptospira noguchii TaxID=28182 RepID=UPI001E6045AE|nr:hypothetical protein [Leptospira noguchii]